MTNPTEEDDGGRLARFRRGLDDDGARLVARLCAVPSFTEDLARYLSAGLEFKHLGFERAFRCIVSADFVEIFGQEFRIDRDVRNQVARNGLRREYDLAGKSVYDLIQRPFADDDRHWPAYLDLPAARPYHLAFVDQEKALGEYTSTYHSATTGVNRYLLGIWSMDQQRWRLLPANAYGPSFLRGMWLYTEGEVDEAFELLKPIADRPEENLEIAIAAHIVGLLEWEHAQHRFPRRQAREPEPEPRRYFDKAIRLSSDLRDSRMRLNRAQALHSLGRFLIEKRTELPRAQEFLDESLRLRDAEDAYDRSAVLYSLGRLYEMTARAAEARKAFDEALELKRLTDDLSGQSRVLQSLGALLMKSDTDAAENRLRESVRIGEELRDSEHTMQAQFTLARMLAQSPDKLEEANGLFRGVLDLARSRGDVKQEAFVLHAWGRMFLEVAPERAVPLLKTSIAVGGNSGMSEHVARTLNTLGWAYINMSAWREAQRSFEASMKNSRDPETAGVSHEGLSVVHERGNRDIEAALREVDEAIASERRTPGRKRLAKYLARRETLVPRRI